MNPARAVAKHARQNVVAYVALFAALGGTAVAAKGGDAPRVVVHSAAFPQSPPPPPGQPAPDAVTSQSFSLGCAANERLISGGFEVAQDFVEVGASRPAGSGASRTWAVELHYPTTRLVSGNSSVTITPGTIYAVCART
jgi:hypothetical protein